MQFVNCANLQSAPNTMLGFERILKSLLFNGVHMDLQCNTLYITVQVVMFRYVLHFGILGSYINIFGLVFSKFQQACTAL